LTAFSTSTENELEDIDETLSEIDESSIDMAEIEASKKDLRSSTRLSFTEAAAEGEAVLRRSRPSGDGGWQSAAA